MTVQDLTPSHSAPTDASLEAQVQSGVLGVVFSLVLGCIKRSKRGTADRIIQTSRIATKRAGIKMGPVGAQDEKTKVPGTYREVGRSCPTECRFHPVHFERASLFSPCYAVRGNVGIHSARGGADAQVSAISALVAMMARQGEIAIARKRSATHREFLAQVGNPRVGARLHVSGDFVKDGEIDAEYIGLLCEAADMVRGHFGVKGNAAVAYTYTHIPRERFEIWRMILKGHGIHVTYSKDNAVSEDFLGGEAIVYAHSEIEELRKLLPAYVTPVLCPAQTRKDWSCSRCTLCSVGNVGMLVVLDPHGSGARKIKALN